MPLQIIRQDITKIKCDAIVCPTNSTLLPGGSLDLSIHQAAGPKLAAACARLGPCPTGGARITRGYRLDCKAVIHTVGPVWQGGEAGEEGLLRSCYAACLELVKKRRFKSAAFPLISAGTNGYPPDRAMKIAVESISAFLAENEAQVYLLVFGRSANLLARSLYSDIRSFIGDNYAEAHMPPPALSNRTPGAAILPPDFSGKPSASWENLSAFQAKEDCFPDQAADFAPDFLPEEPGDSFAPAPKTAFGQTAPRPRKRAPSAARPKPDARGSGAAFSMPAQGRTGYGLPAQAAGLPPSLTAALQHLDESFSQMLLRKIDEKGITDVQCYKKANIDRKLFSKIRSDIRYKPSKTTAIAFAIALELPLEETRDMLMKAGYALSHSNVFDVIIEFFIQSGNYNIYEINEALFAFDQSLLGG